MPFIMPALPPIPAEIRPLFGPEETACAQGDAGRQVLIQWEEVLCHWNSRLADDLLNGSASELDQEEIDYQPMPPSRTFSVPTRYVFRGKGKPLPYNYDSE